MLYRLRWDDLATDWATVPREFMEDLAAALERGSGEYHLCLRIPPPTHWDFRTAEWTPDQLVFESTRIEIEFSRRGHVNTAV